MDVPVAGPSVKKKIVAVCLVLVEVKSPDFTIVFDEKVHCRITGRTRFEREEVPHLAGILSSTRLVELKFEKKMVLLRGRAVLKPYAETKPEVIFINHGRGNEFNRINRELLPGLWSWHVLFSERIEAVIRANKEILATDMRGVVKWRLMAYYGLCKGIPDQLNGMVQRPPGSQRPSMNLKLCILACSTRELALRFVLVVAAPVNVIEGQVSHGAPTIRNQHGWNETRHSSK